MALADARAAWQRTANRCLVQEDAKRAPKFKCSSSIPPFTKQPDSEPTVVCGDLDILTSDSEPFDQSPYSNLSSNSRWWLHLQPRYGYQKCLIDEQLDSSQVMDTCVDNFKSKENAIVAELRNKVCYEVKKDADVLYHDSESLCIGTEKNIPWWRTADTEELVSLVSQRSDEFIENCDLPSPRPRNNTTHIKSVNYNIGRFGHSNFFDSEIGSRIPDDVYDNVCTRVGFFPKHRLASAAEDKRLGDSSTPEKMQTLENNYPHNAELLKALQNSQTRVREAEKVAKQVYAEKEHIVKLVFRQASQILAYKQWLQLLQLENMYIQVKDNVNRSASTIMPIMLPLTPQKTRRVQRSCQKPSGRKRVKRARFQYDTGKFAIVFALGLSVVGAGLDYWVDAMVK